MVGEDSPAQVRGAADGGRGPRPDVRPGQPLSRYGDDDFDALIAWIAADGTPRTVAELQEALRFELGIARRGTHVDRVLGAAARRSGLAVEPDQVPAPAEEKQGPEPEADVPNSTSTGAGSAGSPPDAAQDEPAGSDR